MTNTAKRKIAIEKADRIAKGVERQLSPETYKRDLIMALNFYNSNHDDKDKKKWLISHIAKTDKKLAAEFVKLDEYHFRYAGILARMVDGGSDLEEKEQLLLAERIQFLKDQAGVRQKSEVAKAKKDAAAAAANLPSNVISIQQRMDDKAHELAAEIDGAIDDFIIGGCRSDFSTKNYLAAHLTAAPIAKRIGEFYVGTLDELREAYAGTDEQLVEGYSHLTRRELKRFVDFVEGIINDCNQMVQTAKVNRAPRKRKEKPASVQVSKMKYLKEFAELNLKSAKTETIIGSTEVWFYNTKYRRVGVYKGDLAVKGTTIIGFDIKDSKQFTLRKPEEFFKGMTMNKRSLNAAIKNLTTKPSVPNGRFNEETILLGAF